MTSAGLSLASTVTFMHLARSRKKVKRYWNVERSDHSHDGERSKKQTFSFDMDELDDERWD